MFRSTRELLYSDLVAWRREVRLVPDSSGSSPASILFRSILDLKTLLGAFSVRLFKFKFLIFNKTYQHFWSQFDSYFIHIERLFGVRIICSTVYPDIRLSRQPDIQQMKPDIRQMKLDILQMKPDMKWSRIWNEMKPGIRLFKPDFRISRWIPAIATVGYPAGP